MRRFLLSIFIPLLLLSLPITALADFQKTKIAVLDFQLQGENFETKDMGAIVAEWFITAMVKEGRFDVVERALLQKLLGEQKLAMSGVVDESSASELGKLLGVKVIISGSVLKLQNILEVNARIIDVETGSIIAAESVKSNYSTSLQSLIVQMSEKIIKNFPLEGYVVKVQGKKIIVDLGRLAGVRKDMEFIIFKEGEVIKHPKTGEVLDVTQVQTGKFKITQVMDKIAQGTLTEETNPGAVEYGQFVKSVVGKLKPIAQTQVYGTPPPVAAPSRRSRRRSREGPVSSNEYIKKLRSDNLKNKVWAAKKIMRVKLKDAQVLDVVEDELLKGFSQKTRNRRHIDTMAWLSKALGASALPKYRATLEKVAKNAPSRKLRGYAKKALANY